MPAVGTLQLALLVLLATFLAGESQNSRPIIGVVSEQYSGAPKTSYIAASYVKYLESAGCRVVPILNSYSEEQIKTLFASINGVLFPGGNSNLNDSKYFNVGRMIYNMAIQANDKGDYFPLWGTCLGFELLSVLTADNDSVISPVDAENISLPLTFTLGFLNSRLFNSYTLLEQIWLFLEPLTMNNHQEGLLEETYLNTPSLNTFYEVLSINEDKQGRVFVSTMEAKMYPIYGTQWHPEKNAFEWAPDQAINHSDHAVLIAQRAANFFVNEARKSSHQFPSEMEAEKWLIYNYKPVYSGKAGSEFEQVYLFPEKSSRERSL